MEKKTVSAMMLTLLLTSMLTLAFNIQLMKAHSEGTTYEEFGPRADKLLFKLYPSETAEWDALTRGEIDITDWPLPKSYYELFNSNTINPATGLPYKETINVIFYGDEFDLRILDLNNNNNTYLGNPPNPAYPNPVYPNPTSVKEMRQAIAYLTDRAQLETIIGAGFYSPLYTPVPHSMGAYSHPEIRPGGALEALTYPYSRADAEAELDAGGFPMGPDGWRYWDCNSNGVKDEDEELDLKFFIRSDDPLRKDMGNFIANELEAVKVKVNRTLGTITAASLQVMTNKDFHIYTGGWSFGIDPNHLILWNWDYYWHPDRCYNTAGCNNALFNTYSYGVMYATTYDEVKTNAWLAQEVFASEVLSVPLWSPAGSKAMSRYYTGGNKWTPVDPDDGENAYRGEYWDGVVNMPGYGVDNSFSLLNMHPRGIERGGTIRWGFKTTEIRSFNPIYAQGLWDWNVLESIYEALLVRNSYNPSELNPCLAQDFEVGIYNNPAYGECSKIRFTLRPDATWADGNPITAADVYFTFVELPSILKARGLPNPWWYSAVKSILNFKIFDSYNFEVLLNTRDYFATNWGGKTIILPKHVWKPIVEAGDPTTFAPDPNMIGSGPWRLMEYVQGSHVLLVANKPGSAAKTNLPGSRVIVSPQGYFRYSPVSIDAFTSVINRVTPTEANFNTTIRNSLPESVTINYVIRHKWPNGSTTVLESNSAVVIPGFNTLGHSLPSGGSVYGMHERIVEVIITEPQWVATTIDVTEPYWVTEREDINLDIFVNVQDCVIAGKAFGSYPGHVRWNGAADINDDYKIDARDVSWVQRRANASEWMAPEPQLGVVSLTVSPGSAIVTANTNFTVNVTVNNVVNLRGYQFTLFYDSTVLDLMKAEPNWIYSPWQGVSQINDNYNSTHGKYTQAIYAIESSSPPSFNGTTTLVTLTFQSLQDDSVCFNLTDTLLVNLDAEQIPHVRAPWTPTPPLIPGKDVPAEAPDFFTSVLAKLNIPTTEFAVQALTIWTNYENTNAYWNPLATTWPMGEKSWNFNAVGVKNYADKETGIQATANTLALHYYEPIRQMLAIQTFDEQRLREAVAIWAGLNPSDPYVVNLVDEWCEIYPVSADQPPICIISLQKDGIELDQVDVAEFFDIFAGYSQDDKGIKQIRFSSDDVHDGMPTGEWTQWYDWDASFGDWDAFTKIKRWAFATPGHKEVWAEVKDEAGNSNLCSATIFVPAPALPVLISPLVITPNKEIYNVGDTLEAEFAIKNIGSAPITLDVLTVGGRLNGFIPPEGAPDFTFRSVTLQPNESYQYEGSLTLTQTGNYHFFVAYYIENPTPNEKRLLDKNNWNTCVDLRE